MGTEIERKFLVIGEGWRDHIIRSVGIRQGYLSQAGAVSVRVRLRDNNTAALTLKGEADGISHAEYEYAIPPSDAAELLQLAEPYTLTKRRFDVMEDGMTWEVDVFEGRHAGLVIAEIELPNVDTLVKPPSWIGDDVSEDPRYFNASLAALQRGGQS